MENRYLHVAYPQRSPVDGLFSHDEFSCTLFVHHVMKKIRRFLCWHTVIPLSTIILLPPSCRKQNPSQTTCPENSLHSVHATKPGNTCPEYSHLSVSHSNSSILHKVAPSRDQPTECKEQGRLGETPTYIERGRGLVTTKVPLIALTILATLERCLGHYG